MGYPETKHKQHNENGSLFFMNCLFTLILRLSSNFIRFNKVLLIQFVKCFNKVIDFNF